MHSRRNIILPEPASPARCQTDSVGYNPCIMAKKTEKPVRTAPTKKSDTDKSAASTAKPVASKPTESKPAAKAAPVAAKSQPASAPLTQAPLIDTSLAANAAAALVAGKVALPNAANAPKKESASFKNFKAGLNKPAALGGAFGVIGQSKKSQQSHGGGKQAGHSQTFGADVNRTGVPRRTPG